MFEKFTDNARKSIFFARHEAVLLGAESITPEHLLLGMLDVDVEQIGKLADLDEDWATSIRGKLAAQLKRGDASTSSTDPLPLSEETKNVLRLVLENDSRFKHWRIDMGHLLLGLLSYSGEIQEPKTNDFLVGRILVETGFVKEVVENRISGSSGMAERDESNRVERGVVASLRAMGNGTSTLIFDDVRGDSAVNRISWSSVSFFTSQNYNDEDLDQMKLTASEFQTIGENIVARLLALNGRVK